ncbi:MAG: hypothetical protein N4A47_05805 [Clostridia bacterium]|jgi:hypothetical protein|nr:hypothetical protein [Clostridia bacterium]
MFWRIFNNHISNTDKKKAIKIFENQKSAIRKIKYELSKSNLDQDIAIKEVLKILNINQDMFEIRGEDTGLRKIKGKVYFNSSELIISEDKISFSDHELNENINFEFSKTNRLLLNSFESNRENLSVTLRNGYFDNVEIETQNNVCKIQMDYDKGKIAEGSITHLDVKNYIDALNDTEPENILERVDKASEIFFGAQRMKLTRMEKYIEQTQEGNIEIIGLEGEQGLNNEKG